MPKQPPVVATLTTQFVEFIRSTRLEAKTVEEMEKKIAKEIADVKKLKAKEVSEDDCF